MNVSWSIMTSALHAHPQSRVRCCGALPLAPAVATLMTCQWKHNAASQHIIQLVQALFYRASNPLCAPGVHKHQSLPHVRDRLASKGMVVQHRACMLTVEHPRCAKVLQEQHRP